MRTVAYPVTGSASLLPLRLPSLLCGCGFCIPLHLPHLLGTGVRACLHTPQLKVKSYYLVMLSVWQNAHKAFRVTDLDERSVLSQKGNNPDLNNN
jgi:hypothetical protein